MKNYKLDLAFLDMLFNMTLAFSFLFLMSFMLIRPPSAKEDAALKPKAEFIISLSWPDESLDDQDLWVKLPNGKIVSYGSKDLGYAILDRDDRGTVSNYYVDKSGKIQLIKQRSEIVTIRTLMPGRYVVNVYCFAVNSTWSEFKNPRELPYPVSVALTKVNPMLSEVVKIEKPISRLGEQVTMFAFTVGEDGQIVSVEQDIDEPFIDKFRMPQ